MLRERLLIGGVALARKCNCCCGKCQNLIKCQECCLCLPKQLCVVVTAAGGESCSCTEAGQITDFDCYTQKWSDSITCGDLTIAYSIYVQKDEQGDCRLYLDTDCAGNHSVLMAAPSRAPADAYGPECHSLTYTFSGLSHTCGDADCTTIDIAINARDVFETGESECGENCPGCPCACRTLCLTYADSDGCDETIKVTGEGTWPFEIDCGGSTVSGTIRLLADAYAICGLSLESTDLGDGDHIPQEDCPELYASWSIDLGSGKTATLSVMCGDCGPCDGVVAGCCTAAELGALGCPDPVTASFCGCSGTLPKLGGGCVNWSGAVVCDSETFNLTVECRDPNGSNPRYVLTMGCSAMGADTVEVQASVVSCDPFMLIFLVDGLTCGLSCDPVTVVITR